MAFSIPKQDQPWLIYHPYDDDDEEEEEDPNSTKVVNFFNFNDTSRMVHSVNLPTPTSSFLGSGHGWLVIFDSSLHSVSLFNPFTKNHLLLPSLVDINDPKRIFRSILIPNPTNTIPDTYNGKNLTVFLVLSLNTKRFLFANHGDPNWTDASLGATDMTVALDTTVCKFYGISYLAIVRQDSSVTIWPYAEFLENPSTARKFKEPFRESKDYADVLFRSSTAVPLRESSFYLVSSPTGELWRVSKHWAYGTDTFSVKVHLVTSDGLAEVNNLGGRAIFVGGGNTAFCLLHDVYRSVKQDCVYFLERSVDERLNAIGSYNMRTRNFESIYWEMQPYPQPAWFLPSVLAGRDQAGPLSAHCSCRHAFVSLIQAG